MAQEGPQVRVASTQVHASPFAEVAETRPGAIVRYMGFPMRADTAAAFQGLGALLAREFPGRPVRITATMGGRHKDPGHKQGRSVDFVVEPLTKAESRTVEDLARQTGFRPFNEYVHHSKYKTGAHMHVTLPRGEKALAKR